MELDQDLLFFFAALGAFNALLLSMYLLFNWNKHPKSYLFLGLLLLEHAIRVGFSCLYFFDNVPREFIKLGLTAHLLTGPTLYYFVFFSRQPGNKQTQEAFIHILTVGILLTILGLAFDFKVWDYTFRYAIHSLLSAYLIFTGILLIPVFKKLINSRKEVLEVDVKKVLTVYIAILLICMGFVISLYTNYIVGPVWFSVLLYGGVYLFFRMERHSTTILSYKKKLDEQEVQRVERHLNELMVNERLYRDSNLTLEKLSKKLAVSKYFLSQMLNDNLNKRYHDLINEYRIRDACELLLNMEHYTLEAIAYEVGFNSKSSFFSVFKRMKKTTPAKFRKQERV